MSITLVKIHATASTNEELKFRFRESELPQLTTIYTDHQTAGKGQMGTRWVSEPFKNLTFSILITDYLKDFTSFEISQWVAVCLVEWLHQKLQIQAVIKWPNDILSVHHKLAGVLIENIIQHGKRQASIVGIGLNINQTDFGDLHKAISIAQITGKTWDIKMLLVSFMSYLELQLLNPTAAILKYRSLLYKIDQYTNFLQDGHQFEALVYGTDSRGKLLLKVEDKLESYDLKEIQWVY